MNDLIILKGLPASGKSTWALSWVAEDHLNRTRVNRDDLRKMQSLDWYKFKHSLKVREKIITDFEETLVANALMNELDVVVDATNFKSNQRWFDLVRGLKTQGYNITITEKHFNTDVDTCIYRDSLRGKDTKVGAKVIWNMYKNYINPEAGELPSKYLLKFDKRNYINTSNGRSAYIFDLDGTLSLMNGRSPFKGEDCITDNLNEPVASILDELDYSGNDIIIFSGRNSDKGGEEATKAWLNKYHIKYDLLLMRKPGDFRADTIIKKEMFDSIRDQYIVRGVFDDRNCVVEMWRELGLPCFQVWNGDF